LAWLLAIGTAGSLVACNPLSGGGPLLSNATASTDRIVPGSSGVGNPPGVVEIRYTLREAAKVEANIVGDKASAPLLSAYQDAGEHILRFTGVISSYSPIDTGAIVKQVVSSG